MSRLVVAEWLRRWTRNPLGSPRAGSNPADYEGRMTTFWFRTENVFDYVYPHKAIPKPNDQCSLLTAWLSFMDR